jgi:hypothetical protein
MAKATPLAELQELHRLVAKSLNQRITLDLEDSIPTDAATLGAAIKFLKDNAVTADPADQDDLADLRNKLKEQAAQRRAKGSNIVSLAIGDLQAMEA